MFNAFLFSAIVMTATLVFLLPVTIYRVVKEERRWREVATGWGFLVALGLAAVVHAYAAIEWRTVSGVVAIDAIGLTLTSVALPFLIFDPTNEKKCKQEKGER